MTADWITPAATFMTADSITPAATSKTADSITPAATSKTAHSINPRRNLERQLRRNAYPAVVLSRSAAFATGVAGAHPES
jgi:hypothetical protein